MSDYVKHEGPWLPGMMVIDHGRSRRGRVWKVLDGGDPLVLVCHSDRTISFSLLVNGTRWNVLVGPWLSADISDETTRRLIGSLMADATLPPILRLTKGGD